MFTMSTFDLSRITRIALAQHGVFSVDQAASVDIDPRLIRAATAAGVLAAPHYRIRRFAGTPDTQIAKMWAASLQVGGTSRLSHESALHLHGVDRIPQTVAVTISERTESVTHSYPGVRIHRFNDLLSEHCIDIDGLPTTTLERALVDATSVFSTKRMDYLLDRLTMVDRSTTIGAVSRTLRQVNRRGRKRIRVLGELLDARSATEPAPRSQVEQRFDELIRLSPLPPPIHEFPLPSIGQVSGLVDRAWPAARLIVEVDGRSWHAREISMARDRARDRAAAREGWLPMRFLDQEVAECPDLVLDDLITTYLRRIREFGQIDR